MRHKDPELKKKILTFVDTYYFQYHTTPSTSEIADGVGTVRGTAYKYLVEMAEDGMLTYKDGVIGTEKMGKTSLNSTPIPIVGNIACGLPDLQEEDIEEYISLPRSLVGDDSFYVLHAYGDSMINAGIDPGDLVVIRRQDNAKNGDIIVALVNGATTLKRLIREPGTGRYILHPENDAMEDLVVDSIEVQGVAVNVIKKLH